MHPLGAGVDLRCGHFSVKMYAKTKELDPIGGRAPGTPPKIRQWLGNSTQAPHGAEIDSQQFLRNYHDYTIGVPAEFGQGNV